jgi:hypothetical protein
VPRGGSPLFYGGTLLAIVAPHVAAFGFLVVAIVAVLRVGGDEPQPEAAPRPT